MEAIRLLGIGDVTLEEFEAMLLAYVNAGAPRPLLDGSPQYQRAILQHVRARGDTQMRAVIDSLLGELHS